MKQENISLMEIHVRELAPLLQRLESLLVSKLPETQMRESYRVLRQLKMKQLLNDGEFENLYSLLNDLSDALRLPEKFPNCMAKVVASVQELSSDSKRQLLSILHVIEREAPLVFFQPYRAMYSSQPLMHQDFQASESEGQDPAVAQEVESTPSAPKASTPTSVLPDLVKPTVGLTSPNPYLSLVLEYDAAVAPLSARLTSAEEAGLSDELASPTYYRHYAAVQKIAAARKIGSENLLREALASGKFWLRMNAVMGLADLGYKVSKSDIELALGDAHAELRARFFERFTTEKRCSTGCRMVMRGALEFLSPIGRMAALASLAKFPSASTQKVMVAATFDEDPKIQNLARNWLLKNPVSEQEWHDIFNRIFNTQKLANKESSEST